MIHFLLIDDIDTISDEKLCIFRESTAAPFEGMLFIPVNPFYF